MSKKSEFNILLAIDGSPHSDAAHKLVGAITWPAESRILVLAIVTERWMPLGFESQEQNAGNETLANLQRQDRYAAEHLTTQVAARLHSQGLTIATEILSGRPSQVILQQADDLPADLVVIGAKGLSAPDLFYLGSTAHKIAHYANCPVLVVRPPKHVLPLSIIIAADGSPEAHQAAEFLCALSLPQWAEIMVVAVAEVSAGLPVGENLPVTDALESSYSYSSLTSQLTASVPENVRQSLLDAAEERVVQVTESLHHCGAQVNIDVRLGHPALEILAAAEEQDADLIAIGARGESRAEPFQLGGVAQKVVKYATCSVLMVR